CTRTCDCDDSAWFAYW
nr:immunoglobulin heavy chain junction region [Mus musculus]